MSISNNPQICQEIYLNSIVTVITDKPFELSKTKTEMYLNYIAKNESNSVGSVYK